MGLLSFMRKLPRPGRSFSGTPEQYLAIIQFMARKNNPAYSKDELLQWGEIFQKIMHVKLSPYADFRDLMEKGTPDYSLIAGVDQRYQELKNRQDLKKAIYGEHADLGEDDIMTSQDAGAVFARNMIKDLSKHVQFPDSEKDNLDRL